MTTTTSENHSKIHILRRRVPPPSRLCARRLIGRCVHRKTELSDPSAVLEAFKFIESTAAEYSDEDEDEEGEGKERTIMESRTVRKTNVLQQTRNAHTHVTYTCIHAPTCLSTHARTNTYTYI